MKLDLKTVPKLKPDPLFKGLPRELKNPKVFDSTEKQLALIMYSDHKHKNVLQFSKCERCQIKRMKKQKKIIELGFKSYEQYVEWRKIHTIIKNKQNFQVK